MEALGLGSDVLLISLSVKLFKGRQFLGGRFVPKTFADKYQLKHPSFAETVELPPVDGSQYL